MSDNQNIIKDGRSECATIEETDSMLKFKRIWTLRPVTFVTVLKNGPSDENNVVEHAVLSNI